FYLPAFELFVEVKPSDRLPLADLKKVIEFAMQGDHPTLLIMGTPTKELMFLLDRRHDPVIDEIEAELEDSATEDDVLAIAFESLRDYSAVTFGSTPFVRGWQLIYRTPTPNDEQSLQQ